MRISILFWKPRNIGVNECRNKFYLGKLWPDVAFSVLSGLYSSPFYTVLTLFGCLVFFSYVNRSKAGYCVQSLLTNLSCIKERRTDSPWNRQILLGLVSISYSFRYCDVFFFSVRTFFEIFCFWAIWHALGSLDDYALRGERENFCFQ